ncbi:protein-S-isoprenylcysteine O-methyltransferase Ste14 [Hydrogenophaga palleronii]|uniref:Protein-S-isoprenylcysteine O-methyltransferase Ste14 n=1 Tax=Hydrogenophaga palleronii TaxID=65655 RepID=A0ABU1WR34_9BURK|nr:isoprenylcysteine carboxylmethyltransferase family protein [Hydrogenophaga palleronii]MDR7151738.1 protein-S-isoprenylcysteine O-methyltransferase Ste14 [Hydrogenophaga palleronii]
MKKLLLPPVIWFATVLLMLALHLHQPVAVWLPRPFNWIGLLLVVAGVGMAQWHARHFRRIGTNIDTFGEPGELTRDGLFRRTRNPMYMGMLMAMLGVAVVLGTLTPLAGPLVFFLLVQFWYVPLEERAMAKKFGQRYAEYRQAVPRWW